MNLSVEIVIAVGQSLLSESKESAALASNASEGRRTFLRRQWANLPDVFRPAFTLLAYAFWLHGRLLFGKGLENWSPGQCRYLATRWQASRWGPQRDFVRFAETLVIYAQAEF